MDSNSIINIGFGVFLKQTSTLIPNYLRVSIVNYKSAAYVAGLEAGDYIIEINGRNTLQMSHDESLHYIKTSYEINGQVRLLVASEFCYNWLREHGTLFRLNSEDVSVFSYLDYLKVNRRHVPRLCRIRRVSSSSVFINSFGFSVATFNLSPPNSIVPNASQHATFAHMITGVDVDSPAQLAGVRVNDRVIECDGVNVEHENERQLVDRICQALQATTSRTQSGNQQITLFVVDPETDRFFKSKCIKLHSLLPLVHHISNAIDDYN